MEPPGGIFAFRQTAKILSWLHFRTPLRLCQAKGSAKMEPPGGIFAFRQTAKILSYLTQRHREKHIKICVRKYVSGFRAGQLRTGQDCRWEGLFSDTIRRFRPASSSVP